MFLNSFPEKYVGKSFEIDCVDIEVHGFEDYQPPIFKGPGVIRGEKTGKLFYKIYNQVKYNKDIFTYLRAIQQGNDPKDTHIRLFATAYDGTKWNGSWSIPLVDPLQSSSFFLVKGELEQISARIVKHKGDEIKNCTELFFSDNINLPYSGTVVEKHFHEEELILTKWTSDHHNVMFEGSKISFQKCPDNFYNSVRAQHSEKFEPPYVENWIAETLILMTARVLKPRMIIRHFNDDALVFIRAVSQNTRSGLRPPFCDGPEYMDHYWNLFCSYLSTCKNEGNYEMLKLTQGFCELCLASNGTLQGTLISLSVYIEFCINQIFSTVENTEQTKKIEEFISYARAWKEDMDIHNRAMGLLSTLHKPAIRKQLNILIEQGVISPKHKEIWNSTRPSLAHGKLIDFEKEEEFWHYKNYMISMLYRLIFRIIGYKGLVLDYDGEKFKYSSFEWNGINSEVKAEE